VHLYGAAKGKETLNPSPFIPPFLIVVANDTSLELEKRSRLLSFIRERI
jgi:hypothetical protein